ncbi:hypothetical protein C7B80_20560 [Cyanosarcina cf. burmensis CCALA 770]|nr:hypothetical protein C7B80_20560 [Cyanosarcina cf. burmensis CCALA 770]
MNFNILVAFLNRCPGFHSIYPCLIAFDSLLFHDRFNQVGQNLLSASRCSHSSCDRDLEQRAKQQGTRPTSEQPLPQTEVMQASYHAVLRLAAKNNPFIKKFDMNSLGLCETN